ncbi:MAG: hypothetical protein ACE5EC_02600 [Phycisphaerae bacterium]
MPISPPGHRLMFVVFSVLPFCIFAPTVLLPILREHCDLLAEEARLAEQTAALSQEIARQNDLLKAFATDVTINERLAQLDLHFRKPNEQILPVLPRGFVAPHQAGDEHQTFQSALHIPAHWPRTVRAIERWAEARGLIDPFLDKSLRPALLLMAAGLLIAAFVLFAPRVRRDRAQGQARRRPHSVDPTSVTPPSIA